MNKLIAAILVFVLIFSISIPVVEAKTVCKYTTQKVALREKAKGKKIAILKPNTKVKVLKTGKVWAKVQYKDKVGAIKKLYLNKTKSVRKYTPSYFKRAGRINWKGATFTWYSQRVLPGGGLKIPGRHVDKNGFVCDKDGYICIASTVAMKNKKAIVPTPFGKYGRVYDCGAGSHKWRDVYVAW